MSRTKGAIGNARTLQASRLRGALKGVHRVIKRVGLPERLVPTNDQIVALLPLWVDWEQVERWAQRRADRVGKPITVKLRRKRK
jgi:hypothetical protein